MEFLAVLCAFAETSFISGKYKSAATVRVPSCAFYQFILLLYQLIPWHRTVTLSNSTALTQNRRYQCWFCNSTAEIGFIRAGTQSDNNHRRDWRRN